MQKQNDARLCWARKYIDLTLEDWLCIILTNKAILEIGLDTQSCYVIRHPSTRIETWNLKLISKWEINIKYLGDYNL